MIKWKNINIDSYDIQYNFKIVYCYHYINQNILDYAVNKKSQNFSDFKHKCLFLAYIKCPLLTVLCLLYSTDPGW